MSTGQMSESGNWKCQAKVFDYACQRLIESFFRGCRKYTIHVPILETEDTGYKFLCKKLKETEPFCYILLKLINAAEGHKFMDFLVQYYSSTQGCSLSAIRS